ncbi:hypothetical protein SAMN05660337_2105 [Maridesulfovibrio ferrireducens]|uniref:CULT domain-containing protein n=1 Tax=Maridesulfovibrio ferrireducens TaxID=246191 RepID=A0A1G9HE04_9BACT|nr:cereblon family protein [Maridesulfovibrio ferrireducens]SDL10713.1 hypothetical protein SAMN05660337_2105 [Maridesulfovibrio ferrireducens]
MNNLSHPTAMSLLKTARDTNSSVRNGLQDDSELNTSKYEQFIICKECEHKLTKPTFAIQVNDSHEHSFFNPHGYVFQLRCFSNASGCLTEGPPSSEFTWFSGYSWQITFCGKCFSHLGWKFTSDSNSFFGLIKDKIKNSAK